jgi:hypothetical protein
MHNNPARLRPNNRNAGMAKTLATARSIRYSLDNNIIRLLVLAPRIFLTAISLILDVAEYETKAKRPMHAIKIARRVKAKNIFQTEHQFYIEY